MLFVCSMQSQLTAAVCFTVHHEREEEDLYHVQFTSPESGEGKVLKRSSCGFVDGQRSTLDRWLLFFTMVKNIMNRYFSVFIIN